jgi:hypothetical protein
MGLTHLYQGRHQKAVWPLPVLLDARQNEFKETHFLGIKNQNTSLIIFFFFFW